MTRKDRERDLQDVLREERSHGRKQRIDTEAERREGAEKQAVVDVLRSGDEKQFRKIMATLGFNAAETEEKLKAFRAARAELERLGP